MQNFKSGQISLERSLSLTKSILRGDVEVCEGIQINSTTDKKDSFNFSHFKTERDEPILIEHVGLAQLVYQKSIEQFYTKHIKEDGSVENEFTVLPEGCHIADVVEQCNPDVLGWYKLDNGKPLELAVTSKGFIEYVSRTSFEEAYFNNKNSENLNAHITDRVRAVTGAIGEAICVYQEKLAENGLTERVGSLTAVTVSEGIALQKSVADLQEDAQTLFLGADLFSNQTCNEQ